MKQSADRWDSAFEEATRRAAILRETPQLSLSEYRKIVERGRTRYRRAIESGELQRPGQCSKCGTNCKPEGHHKDYTQPLEVDWLCSHCHRTYPQRSPQRQANTIGSRNRRRVRHPHN